MRKQSIPFFILPFVFLFGSVKQAHATEDPALVVKKLQGTWNEVVRGESSCDDKKYFHTFSLSANGLILTLRYVVPVDRIAGVVSEVNYRILYSDQNSVMLYKEGEDFVHRDSGDKIIRHLILETAESYAWRLYGKPPEYRAVTGGFRCSR